MPDRLTCPSCRESALVGETDFNCPLCGAEIPDYELPEGKLRRKRRKAPSYATSHTRKPEPDESSATIVCFVLAWFLTPLFIPLMLCAYLCAKTRKWQRIIGWSVVGLLGLIIAASGMALLVMWVTK